MRAPGQSASETVLARKAQEIFELVTDRPWADASEDERRLARWAANSDIRAADAEAEAWIVSDAEQCYR